MNTIFLLSSDNNNRSELLKKQIIHYYIANGDVTIADLSRDLVNQDTEIKLSKLGEQASAFGACLLSRSKLPE